MIDNNADPVKIKHFFGHTNDQSGLYFLKRRTSGSIICMKKFAIDFSNIGPDELLECGWKYSRLRRGLVVLKKDMKDAPRDYQNFRTLIEGSRM